jgi:hypothetical protein
MVNDRHFVIDFSLNNIFPSHIHPFPPLSVFLQTTLVGPTLHIWYGSLSKLIPGPGVVNTLKRVALDQGMFAPAFITTFMTSNLLLTGKSLDQV